MKKCRWFSSPGFLWSSWRQRLRPTLQPSSEGERRTWLRIELRPFASPFGGKVGLGPRRAGFQLYPAFVRPEPDADFNKIVGKLPRSAHRRPPIGTTSDRVILDVGYLLLPENLPADRGASKWHHSVDLCRALRSAPAGNPAEYRPVYQAGAARIIKIESWGPKRSRSGAITRLFNSALAASCGRALNGGQQEARGVGATPHRRVRRPRNRCVA